MAWIKRSDPAEPAVEQEPVTPPSAEESDIIEITIPEEDKPETKDKSESRRYNKNGRRRGQRRGAAVLGLLVLIFAVIGVIATVAGGILVIRKARDTSYLKEDMYYTLLPLMQYAPTAFESAEESQQDALIQAALYQITNREWIRQQQDPEYLSPYEVDEFGRTIIPINDVTASYNQLFGTDSLPYCHTFGEDAGTYFTYEYNTDEQVYYVPYTTTASAYEPVVDTIQRAGDLYRVRVGYVHLQDITVDDHGNQVKDLAKATYFQIYSVERTEDDHFVIRSVADETPAK